jgi:phenylpyruvate tautomerase PptA (4-oxalocrotonate tautomerase family)
MISTWRESWGVGDEAVLAVPLGDCSCPETDREMKQTVAHKIREAIDRNLFIDCQRHVVAIEEPYSAPFSACLSAFSARSFSIAARTSASHGKSSVAGS